MNPLKTYNKRDSCKNAVKVSQLYTTYYNRCVHVHHGLFEQNSLFENANSKNK